jgi:hypothetical protein
MENWEAFEVAVAAFLQALEPDANVTQNIHLPDKDTGTPRQRDVWIETTYGGHLPILILVSCKRETTKLDQQDMDAFVGELRSSGAHLGVLYSYSGYTKTALKKARVLGICCCSLYENEPPDVPDVLTFSALCFAERCRLTLRGNANSSISTMNELFDRRISQSDHRSVMEVLIERHDTNRREMLTQVGTLKPYPSIWYSRVEVRLEDGQIPVTIELEGSWNVYEAKNESWLVNGSYSFINRDFKGSVTTPAIDRLGSHPGPGWERVETDTVPVRRNVLSILLYGPDVAAHLREYCARRSPTSFISEMTPPTDLKSPRA